MTALHVLKEGIGCPVITRKRLFRPSTWEAQQTSSEPKRGLSPAGRCNDLGNRRVQPVTAARADASAQLHFPNFTTAVVLAAGRRRPAWTPSECLVQALAVVVVAITRGVSCLSALELRIPRQVIKPGDSSVEALLPQGGGCFELDASGWSWVLLIDAVGGPPCRNFANEGGAWVASRRGPGRLGVVLAGVISNLLGEVGH
jgi:hypothetical protein